MAAERAQFPDASACRLLLQKYQLPDGIQRHSGQVARVATALGEELQRRGVALSLGLVQAAAWLHDIGKSPLAGEERKRLGHARVSARIVRQEGYPQLAAVVEKHVLDTIVDPAQAPATWEEKIVFYADKVVTDRVISLAERFADLRRRYPGIGDLLDRAEGPTRQLEAELFGLLGVEPAAFLRRLEAAHPEPPGSGEIPGSGD